MTDDQAIAAYLEHLQASRGRLPRTAEAYGLALSRLREFLGPERSVLSATPIEVETFAGVWLHKRGVVARSRKPYVSALRGFFRWAQSRGLAQVNAASELAQPKTGRPLPHVLSLASAEKLMWAPDLATFVGIRDAAMLALLIGCGLRVTGLVSLDEEDLQPLQIDGKPRLQLRVTEKGGRERLLPVPREAEMLLRVYLQHEDLAGYDRLVTDRSGRARRVLFVATQRGACPPDQWRGDRLRLRRQAVWRMIQRHGQRAGVPAEERHPHAFRHLFGTELAEDEVDVITRQGLMGHVDSKSTAIYTDLAVRRRMAVVDKAAPLAKLTTPVSELLKRL
jgi:site-specific recombinase XerD